MQNRMPDRPVPALLLCGLIAVLFSGCSVISKNIRQEAAPDINFAELKRDTEAYKGQTVILGGYILDIENLAEKTRLMVLQAPLDFQDEPGDRDRSQGRFRIVYQGFLDPAIYKKGRKITVAGEIVGAETVRINRHDYTLPVLRMREIHLWQQRPERPEYPYYYDPFFDPFYPWPDRRFPYWWRHPYYFR